MPKNGICPTDGGKICINHAKFDANLKATHVYCILSQESGAGGDDPPPSATTSNNAGRTGSSASQCLPNVYNAGPALHIPTSQGRRAKKIRGTDLLWNDIAARW